MGLIEWFADSCFVNARLHYPQVAVVHSPPTGACAERGNGRGEILSYRPFCIVLKVQEGWEWASRYCF